MRGCFPWLGRTTRSPSQCPGITRWSISDGRTWMLTISGILPRRSSPAKRGRAQRIWRRLQKSRRSAASSRRGSIPEPNNEAAGGSASCGPNALAPSNSPPWSGGVPGSGNQGAALGDGSLAAISQGAAACSPPTVPASGDARKPVRAGAAARRGVARVAARVPRSAGRRTDCAESGLPAADGGACRGSAAGGAGDGAASDAVAARMRRTAALRSRCILACSCARGLSIFDSGANTCGSMRRRLRTSVALRASPAQGFAALRVASWPK
jgi:hypothetical protein